MPSFATGEVDLYAEVRGAGPPVVLLMGLACQLTMWPRELVDGLVDAGHQVVLVDNRDIGLSSWLDHLGIPDLSRVAVARVLRLKSAAPYQLPDMARDVLGLMDALGLADAHLVGASMGGMIAQEVTIQAGDRVRSLTSIMSSPGDPFNTTGDLRVLSAMNGSEIRSVEDAMDTRMRVTRAINGGRLPLDEAAIRDAAAADYERAFHPAGVPRQLAAIVGSRNRKAGLRQIAVPTHVIHGDADPFVPLRGGRATARLVPDATLQIVPDMGHHVSPLTVPPLLEGILTATRRGEARTRPG